LEKGGGKGAFFSLPKKKKNPTNITRKGKSIINQSPIEKREEWRGEKEQLSLLKDLA